MGATVRSKARGHRMTRILLAAVAAVTLLAVTMPGAVLGVGQILDVHDSGGNVDRRSGAVQPSAAQQAAAADLGATVRWNKFGTPRSLIRHGGFLATGLSGPDAATVARSWINQNRALFKLSSTAPSTLALESDSPMVAARAMRSSSASCSEASRPPEMASSPSASPETRRRPGRSPTSRLPPLARRRLRLAHNCPHRPPGGWLPWTRAGPSA